MMGVTKSEFEENEILQDSMMFRLIQISENARKLSDEFRASQCDIPTVYETVKGTITK